jgi:hypothetical protein
MAHAQKPDLVFRRNGRVHLNRRGRQFSRLLAAEMCASAVVMLDTPCSEVAWEYWLPTPFANFPFPSSSVRHPVPAGFNWTLHHEKHIFVISYIWSNWRLVITFIRARHFSLSWLVHCANYTSLSSVDHNRLYIPWMHITPQNHNSDCNFNR